MADQEIIDKATPPTVDQSDVETAESLSSKISNLHVLNESLQTVSKTCKDIKESNAYVKYGLDVAESSFDKAVKAGKSVLDSSPFAPVTTKAIENFQYLDKEAGVIVGKFFGTKTESESPENKELQKNGALATAENRIEELQKRIVDVSTALLVTKESTASFLGRKLFEITSFLFFIPKYAIVSFLHLLRFTPESSRKRKERSSISEELHNLEPSPVKRKYGDRKSSSDEESLVEMLIRVNKDYVSDEDGDYVLPETDLDCTGDELDESDETEEENRKELVDLKQDCKEHSMTPVHNRNNRKIDNLESKDLNKEEKSKDQSSPKPTKDDPLCATLVQVCSQPEQQKLMSTDKKTTEKEPLKSHDITSKENADTPHDKTAESKETNAGEGKSASASKEITPSSKTRKSLKSPLLEKLLSPGRRKSERGKGKSDKEIPQNEATNSEKAKSEKSEKSKKSEKASAQLEKSEKSGKAEKSEKAGNPEKPTSSEAVSDKTNPTMNLVSGPFDVFRMGGKKSK